MPINSYISPALNHQASSSNNDTITERPSISGGSRSSIQIQPDMQRLNSAPIAPHHHSHPQPQQPQSIHQQAPHLSDRRRRGSSLGNLFSTIASSFRAQTPVSAYPNNSPSSLSHHPSTATIRPSLGDSRTNSGNPRTSSNQSLNLASSPTMADLGSLSIAANNNIHASSGNVPTNRSSISLANNDSDEQMANVHETLEEEDDLDDNMEHARTRQNSTAVQQTLPLAEGVNAKREPDGSFSVRLTPFIDHSSSSPALYFSPLIRKAKPGMRLPIGRYTEKNREAAQAPHGSSAAIVFKSKVVSRTHAEILVDDHGNWYIKDLKSSSGTFLNHIRLSPAGQESEDCMVSDGDILQLGMDFRGGSEEIFRCVKVRVELNRSWKRKTHKFNKNAHKQLLGQETECCICLNGLKVGDSIFISPCSHSWHYRCIRPLLVRNYPQFHCPNCRCITDLEDDDDDEDENEDEDEDENKTPEEES